MFLYVYICEYVCMYVYMCVFVYITVIYSLSNCLSVLKQPWILRYLLHDGADASYSL